ncbi:MAG: ABC transporter substrate-binding protein [Micromonosporaceae bacterium]|jgi:NitT/TauT family transport system substrate-binding protein|nr:ABC transporter substrate-binding protein [Micromonosporaceae bacterium]
MNRRLSRGLVAVATCALVASCGHGDDNGSSSGNGKDLATVRIGSEKVTSDAGIFIADKLGYFKEVGIKVEYVRLKDAPTITNALATGRLEVAGASLAPGVFASGNQNIGLKIVGDKQSIRPGVSATRFAVKPEYDRGDIKQTLNALRGKKIAVHSKLSIQVFMLNNLLQHNGMSMSDFQVVPVQAPDQVAAFKGGSIDAAVMLEPYLTQGIREGVVKLASDMTETAPPEGEVLTGLIYGKTMLENRELGNNFMLAYMRGVRAYNDAMFYGKNKDQVVSIIAKEADKPEDLIRNTFPAGLDPEQRLDPAYLGRLQDFYVAQKVLDKPTDINSLIDTSFAENAVKKLGKYQPPKS